MPLAISLLMNKIVTNDNCHKQIIDQQSHQLTQIHQHHRTENTANEWLKWRSDNKIKGNNKSFADRYLDPQQKQKSWSQTNTKWRSEVKSSKRKYVVANEKQWWWATSINNIMQWYHNILMYQCSNWNNWANLIRQKVMWSANTHWSTTAGVTSRSQWSVVFLAVPKIE